MNNPLISIIIPVYQDEANIEKCLLSVMNQTYTNLQIIVVDDGSTDDSSRIVDSFAEKDCRISTIHQKRMGSAAARNRGIEAAKGDFIGFVDSDDYIDLKMYEYLYSLMTNDVDIVECEFAKVFNDNYVFDCENPSFYRMNTTEAMAEHITDRCFKQIVWNKLYRRSVIGDERFIVGKPLEDERFTYKVIAKAKKLIHSNKICYAYRQRSDSIIHSLSVQERIEGLNARIERHEYIRNNFKSLEALDIKELIFFAIYNGQIILRCLDKVESKTALNYIKESIGKYQYNVQSYSLKERLWLTLFKLSFEGTCRLRNILNIGL